MKRISILIAIFILAFLVRIYFMINSEGKLEMDEWEYDRLAMNLVEGKGYINSTDGAPTSLRPPLYPAFLALIYKVFGHNHFIVRFIQVLIGSATVCLLYLVTEKMFNKVTALIVAIFSSFYTTFVVSARLLYTETVFSFILILITYLVINANKPSIIKFCVIGFLCGFLTLIRSTGFLMPFIAVFYMAILAGRQHALSIKKIALSGFMLLLCFTSVILPWSIRNYNVHKHLVLISTNAGLNMYQGTIRTPGRIFDLDPNDEIGIRGNNIANEAERNAFFTRVAFDRYKEDPLLALKMLVVRLLFFWNVIDWDIMGGDVINYHYVFILPFAIFGAIFAIKRKKDISFILILIAYFTSFVLLFPGLPRYRVSIDGYLIMLGSWSIYEFFHKQRRKTYPLLFVGSYFIFTYFLYRYSLETKYFIKGIAEKLGLW